MDGIGKSWWKVLESGLSINAQNSINEVAVFALLSDAVKHNHCIYNYSVNGNLSIDSEEFIDLLNKLGGRVISTTMSKIETVESDDYIAVWHDAILSVEFDHDWIYIKMSSIDKELVIKVKELAQKVITQKTRGKAYVFVSSSQGGPELRQLHGEAGVPLEYGNYDKNIIQKYEHVIKNFNDPKAYNGGLVIIDGPAGAGKTHLVRGIIDAIENATFILIPASMITDIMNPQFMPILMHHKEKKRHMILIIEDADSVLVERAADNMSAISTLLNLGDGILGRMFDIRLICTTNSKFLEIDHALVRPGRLCAHINIDKLSIEQSNEIYSRLTKKDEKPFTKNMSLAEIYNAANNQIIT